MRIPFVANIRFYESVRSTSLNVVPRKQFIEADNLVLGDAAEAVGQPILRVDKVIPTAPVYGKRGAAQWSRCLQVRRAIAAIADFQEQSFFAHPRKIASGNADGRQLGCSHFTQLAGQCNGSLSERRLRPAGGAQGFGAAPVTFADFRRLRHVLA